MKRDEWQFEYSTVDLARAAETKRDHRRERLAWWENQKASVMAEVRETGIEVSESVAAGYSNTNAGFGPQVMVRADLQRRLTECHIKIKEHSDAAREYEGWREVLESNLGNRLHLDYDDWLYFFSEN